MNFLQHFAILIDFCLLAKPLTLIRAAFIINHKIILYTAYSFLLQFITRRYLNIFYFTCGNIKLKVKKSVVILRPDLTL